MSSDYTLYLGLLCQRFQPCDDCDELDMVLEEIVAEGYYRVELTNIDLFVNDHGLISNANLIQFGIAKSNWGVVTHFGIWLEPEGYDSCIDISPFTEPVNIGYGFIASFSPGTLVLKDPEQIKELIESLKEDGEEYSVN